MAVSTSKNYHDNLFKALKDVETDGTPEDYHRLLNHAIERWEQESIDDIHQFANETREHIYRTIRPQSDRIDENLRDLEQLFLQARENRAAYEQNLIQWSKKLQRLQKMLDDQQEETRRTPSNDNPINEVEQSDRSCWQEYPKDQEPSEFISGKFIRRFKLEECGDDYFLVMGIISDGSSTGSKSYKNPSFYGWTKDNLVYLAGVPESRYQNYRSDYRTGTCIQLTLDCDQQEIIWFNEETRQTSRLPIDLNKCPFPWILCVYFQSFHD